MVSTLSRQEKFNQVRRNFCFYLDIQEHGLARSISRRLQDMGLQQEVVLSTRVTHVVRDGAPTTREAARWREPARARADAMLARVRRDTPANYVLLTVEKAINLLDKLYDAFFTAPRKANVRHFSKHYIKIEFLDKACRPLYKEFDAWPEISVEPHPPKDKGEKNESTNPGVTVNNNYHNTTQSHEMTRKNRPRIKEKEDKEPRGGYCEACGADFADLAAHARSPRHAAFARDTGNFLALDSLIGAAFPPVNGERRSLRHGCPEPPAPARAGAGGALRQGCPGPPARACAGAAPELPRRAARCRRADERQYYRVVGVSTKLRSSGGFAPKRKDSPPSPRSPPMCNGAKPLVVKFRKVRRSELSVLSDEAEQFMFPRRASSSSSAATDDDETPPRRRSPPRRSPLPAAPPAPPRRRLARPTALKEESSEEDSWLDDKRRRKRRVVPVVRRTRRAPCRPPSAEPEPPPAPAPPAAEAEAATPPTPPAAPAEPSASPLREEPHEEPAEKCMKWEDGRLKYTPAVEQLEFAFESVPRSEPWFEVFQRQDQDKVLVKNVPRCFALYSKSAKLPYEMGQLPPLKPDCCPLSALPRRERAGPGAGAGGAGAARYGTRGLKTRKLHRRVAAAAALDPRPRKSPREHASTLAMLGSAGLRRRADDAKSTASEDTASDATGARAEPAPSAAQQASERLRQFLAEVFQDAEFDAPEAPGDAPALGAAAPDVLGLVSECDGCDLIRDEVRRAAQARSRRRGRFKKKNRTGWPNKKKQKKGSRANSSEERKTESSLDRSSAGSGAARDTCDELSEADDAAPGDEAMDVDGAPDDERPGEKDPADEKPPRLDAIPEEKPVQPDEKPDEKPLRLDVKVLLEDKKDKAKAEKVKGSSSVSESEEREERARKKKRALDKLGSWLQPVVRVARVDPAAARRLRSARPQRLR